MTIVLDKYYDRTDPADNYEQHLFRAGYGLQSAEMNELQSTLRARMQAISDVIFKDGNIVRDCQCYVDDITGAVTLASGALYVRGAIRGVAPATFTIPVDQTVNIGVRLVSTVVTELEDASLRDPAIGTRNYNEAGAGRLQVTTTWAWDGDGGAGDFFVVYTVENGVLLGKEPPPQLDAVSTAIARYDRDSAGGMYIVDGLNVTAELNEGTGKLTTLISEGHARVNGFRIELPRSLRLSENIDRDTKAIISEPKTFTPDGSGNMRIDLDFFPLVSLTQIRFTKQVTETVTHGAFSGAQDTLANTSVLSIVSVNQGGTTYVAGTDYQLTAGKVDWSPAGAEPAPGSTYTVVYRYQSTVPTITGVDKYGFTISGVVTGTLVLVDYLFGMPRKDAIVVDQDGRVSRLKGVATIYEPPEPIVPNDMLRIATLQHNWIDDPIVISDAVKVLPMNELQGMRSMIDDLYDLVAQERLRNDIGLSETAARRGVFVDPMTNDNLRDAGISQTGAIVNGELQLPITPSISQIGTAYTQPVLLDYTLEAVIDQPLRTGQMKINPYQAFEPLDAVLKITPAVDMWTDTNTTWTSDSVRRFSTRISGSFSSVSTISSTSVDVEFCRVRDLSFEITGFAPGETLSSLKFDGISVTPENP